MANRHRGAGFTSGARKMEMPPPPWDGVEARDDETRLMPRKTRGGSSSSRKASKALAYSALQPDGPTLPWSTQGESLQTVSDVLPVLPRVPYIPVVTQPDYVPPPPPLSPSSQEPVTSSFQAPRDQLLHAPERDLRTTFSSEAVLIADLLRVRFAKRRYGPARYRLRVDDPDGPSTAGGRLARQALSLVSRDGSVPAIVCGWVDVSKREAQLRSHGVVVRRHQRHHGSPPDLSAQEYEKFLRLLMDTLFEGGIRLLLLLPDEQEAPLARPQAESTRGTLSSILGVTLIAALAFILGMHVAHVTPWLEYAQALLR